MQSIMAFIKRLIELPKPGEETFFIWGARQSGKSTWLRHLYPAVFWIDLLKSDAMHRYLMRPALLREELALKPVPFVVIDEIQKVPALLDEVHWLHEQKGIRFALCGSSARKLRRGHGNLLGGRALRYELYGLSAAEMGKDFDLVRMLNQGTLPRIYESSNYRARMNSYTADYLKEEVMEEGLVRNLPPFSRFLTAAALTDTEQVNFTNISRELGISRETVRGYFEILSDTLLARMLPPYRKRPKRRLSLADKFYFSDVGVVNFLARRGSVSPGGELFGKAFENWVFHELNCYNSYRQRFAEFSFWRLSSGIEVDFIVNDLECAIESKSSSTVRQEHLKGLRELQEEHGAIKHRIVVSLEPTSRITADGIMIVSVHDFVERLWGGEFF